MEVFTQELLQFHGNGKHRHNWLKLKEIFLRNIQLVEQAAIVKDQHHGTLLLAIAHDISSSFRASLIVTLMLMYQMEFLAEETNNFFIFEVRQFFDYITPQEAECASQELAHLAHTVTRLTCEMHCPTTVIPSLSRLSSTVSPGPSCLTAIHADILQACIAGKMYSYAHDFISNNSILEINPKKSFLEPSDFLKYFYYSGIVYIAVKDFQKALDCFSEVLSFPAEILSAVCVEAYKKAIFVSLIQTGKEYKDFFPSNASPAVKKLLSFVSDEGDASVPASSSASCGTLTLTLQPYHLIEQHYLVNDLSPAVLSSEAVMPMLAEDGNYGLAKQVLESMYTHRIEKISKAYMSISLDKLTTLVGGGYTPSSMERKLLHMNKQGTIIAKLNNITGLVTFHDLTSKYTDSVAFLASMRAQLNETAQLSGQLRSVHMEVLSSEKYLKKSVATSLGKVEGVGGGGGISLADHDVDLSDEYYYE